MAGRAGIGCGLVGVVLLTTGGCVSMDKHQRLEQSHRRVVAEKEAVELELYDERSANDALRARIDALEKSAESETELVANLRQENERLAQYLDDARKTVERIANQQQLGDINMVGPKLPAELDETLREFAGQYGDQVVYDPSNGTVKWKSDLLFPVGSDVLKEPSMASLRAFADVIKSPAARNFEVFVVGHTDNAPVKNPATREKHPSNWHLSCHRAISVAKTMIQNGYPADQLATVGCGEHRPVADNAAPSGKSQNRRVEIYLLPRGAVVSSSVAVAPVGNTGVRGSN